MKPNTMKFSLTHLFLLLMMIILMFMIYFIENPIIKWMLMEISSCFMIILLNITQKYKNISMIYFVITSIVSTFLFSIIIFSEYWLYSSYQCNLNNIFSSLIQLLLFLKIGTFPFHMWMIYLYENMSWMNIFIFSTINKILPIYLLCTLTDMTTFTLKLILMNSIISSVNSIANNYSIPKILAFSSMNHTSYMIMFCWMDSLSLITYFLLYSINTYLLLSYMNRYARRINDNLLTYFPDKKSMLMYSILMISYSMLPPSMFFTTKWFYFMHMLNNTELNISLMIMMFCSIIMTWAYLSMVNYNIMTNKTSKKHIQPMYYHIKMFFKWSITILIIFIIIFISINY